MIRQNRPRRTAPSEKYGAMPTVASGNRCCGPIRQVWPAAQGTGGLLRRDGDPITSGMYLETQRGSLPEDALAPPSGAEPHCPAGARTGPDRPRSRIRRGIDVLLSAKRVGPAGKVYGLDMTDEMLALARENQRKAGAANVEFLKGTIEADSTA